MQQYCDFLKYQGASVSLGVSQSQVLESKRLANCPCQYLVDLQSNKPTITDSRMDYNLTKNHNFYDLLPIDESLDFPHNEEKTYYVEDNSMSFVGMFAVEDGVVAFGDTRSTIVNPFGMRCEEKGRVAKKIFCGKDFLLTTWKANRYFSRFDKEETIEDFVEKNIEEVSPLELLSLFVKEIAANNKNLEREFCFGIGYKLQEKYIVQEAIVKQNILSFFPVKEMIWVGTGFYIEQIFQLNSPQKENAFEEMKNNVQTIMKKANTFNGYNPAGSPFYFGMLGDYSGMVEIGKF